MECEQCGADREGRASGMCHECGTAWGNRVHRPQRMIGTAAFTCGEVDRVYGGPEEGGWYYTHFEPERVIIVPARKAERCERLLQKWEDRQNEGRPSISSVLSRGRARCPQRKGRTMSSFAKLILVLGAAWAVLTFEAAAFSPVCSTITGGFAKLERALQ
jgi:hypothetical protein